ncbi:MAG: 1-pyrroline-5-carboxylate dehydrogenase, partial [Bacteroidetes bacterium]
MSKGFFKVPTPVNEPVLSYGPGTKERTELKEMIDKFRSEEIEIPMWIGGKDVKSGNLVPMSPPHDHKHILGHYHQGDESHINQAIDAAMAAKEDWINLPWEHRASIFLKAADLLAGPYRQKINAATMLGQSKNAFQAEIDAACEFIDFLKFNVHYMTEIYKQQPDSAPGMWNRLEQRPLEGFVFALTPFNFTSIAGNL